MDFSELTEKALTIMQKLSVEIGPRQAGSDQEAAARSFLKNEMENLGYRCQEQPVYHPGDRAAISPFIFCILLIFMGWIFPRFPLVAILYPIINLWVPNLSRLESKLWPRKETSQNLYCDFVEQDDAVPLLVFCAHVDTARVIPFRSPGWLKVYAHFMTVTQRIAILIALLSLFLLLGFAIPVWVGWIVAAVCTIIGGVYLVLEYINQFRHGAEVSCGAIDNASGVGICVALGQYFKTTPVKRMQVAFLFTTAEENGMNGALAFAGIQKKSSRKTGMMNLDMVGAGQQLCMVTQAGLIRPLRTSPVFNQALRDAYPPVKGVTYTMRGGDFESFVSNGFQAASIETRGSSQAEMAYHTVDDQYELIEAPTVKLVIKTLTEFTERLSYSEWALK